LLLEQGIDVGIAAVGVGAVARNDLGEARGRVAIERARADAYPLGLLGGDQGEVGAALHGAYLETDAHRLEVADDGLPEGKVGGEADEALRPQSRWDSPPRPGAAWPSPDRRDMARGAERTRRCAARDCPPASRRPASPHRSALDDRWRSWRPGGRDD